MIGLQSSKKHLMCIHDGVDTLGQLKAPAALRLANGEPARSGWTLATDQLHVNHGSFGAVPKQVQILQASLKQQMEDAPVRWFIELPEKIAAARQEIASRLKVDVHSLAMVPNATAGTTSVFHSIELSKGAEIVVTDHGYGAVTMGAERLARRIGGSVVTAVVPIDADEDIAAKAIEAVFTDRTELVVVDQVTSPTGLRLPVAKVIAAAHKRGIRVLVDAAHAAGLFENPPTANLNADYWTGNLHKFACAPRGAAVLIANEKNAQELFPIIDSWGAPYDFPERFDHQGTVDSTSYLAASASWDFIESNFGWAKVRTYMDAVSSYGAEIIGEAFSKLTGEDHRSVAKLTMNALKLVKLPAGLVNESMDANTLRDRCMRELDLQAAFTFHAGVGYLRLSSHAYNTASDYEEFAERIVPALCEIAMNNDSSQSTREPQKSS